VTGGDGDDILVGGSGTDVLTGGDGNDALYGGGGVNILDGGAGDDLLHAGPGAAWVFGGEGYDTAFFDFPAGGIGLNLLNPNLSNRRCLGTGLYRRRAVQPDGL